VPFPGKSRDVWQGLAGDGDARYVISNAKIVCGNLGFHAPVFVGCSGPSGECKQLFAVPPLERMDHILGPASHRASLLMIIDDETTVNVIRKVLSAGKPARKATPVERVKSDPARSSESGSTPSPTVSVADVKERPTPAQNDGKRKAPERGSVKGLVVKRKRGRFSEMPAPVTTFNHYEATRCQTCQKDRFDCAAFQIVCWPACC
jgi:hypothetical protein